MSRRGFEAYAILAPAVLGPLAFWAWHRRLGGDLRLVLLAWLVPVLWGYLVPGIGTNVLKVWEFDTRLRLGRFRPQHGFVFGSATAALAWVCHLPATRPLDILRATLVTASVLGFWNLLYEVGALRSGLLRVYTQPWADGLPAESIAIDYAPWFFGGFGACYGAGLAAGEWLASKGLLTAWTYAALFTGTLATSILLPLLLYRRHAFRAHGHSGCRPVPRPQ